jgi:arylsulfatase A-like enzyme
MRLLLLSLILAVHVTAAPERPNILFLMGDDWSSPHASILGDPIVKTPNFDRIAREGVLFTHAFVSSPSCTPSRFATASGQFHWRLEGGANLWGSLPAGTEVYAEMLQKAGYLIGHTRKGGAPSRHEHTGRDPFGSDYQNFRLFLTKRPPDAPFCFWFGTGDPHRPYKLNSGVESGMDPSKVVVPACLPDNAVTRADLCDYFWEVQRFDREAGELLARLEALGELENTIVVMTGDNGLPFPRCKANLYDLGTRVPLAIRWGTRIKGARTVDDFVSLTDLAPTFLEAAGLKPGEKMTGRSLLPMLLSGKSGRVESDRDHVLTGMDHHVVSRPARAIRTRDFLYIRNIEPASWPGARGKWKTRENDHSFAVDPGPTKWDMIDNRKTPDAKRRYRLAFGKRPGEELYDLRKDPEQMVNVAAKPEYAEVKARLRKLLLRELHDTGDPRS